MKIDLVGPKRRGLRARAQRGGRLPGRGRRGVPHRVHRRPGRPAPRAAVPRDRRRRPGPRHLDAVRARDPRARRAGGGGHRPDRHARLAKRRVADERRPIRRSPRRAPPASSTTSTTAWPGACCPSSTRAAGLSVRARSACWPRRTRRPGALVQLGPGRCRTGPAASRSSSAGCCSRPAALFAIALGLRPRPVAARRGRPRDRDGHGLPDAHRRHRRRRRTRLARRGGGGLPVLARRRVRHRGHRRGRRRGSARRVRQRSASWPRSRPPPASWSLVRMRETRPSGPGRAPDRVSPAGRRGPGPSNFGADHDQQRRS